MPLVLKGGGGGSKSRKKGRSAIRREPRSSTARGPQGLSTQSTSSQKRAPRNTGPKGAKAVGTFGQESASQPIKALETRGRGKVRKTGVFARPLSEDTQGNARESRRLKRKVRSAEEKAPGQTLPIQRQPVGPNLTSKQRSGLVRSQTRRLKGRSPAERNRAFEVGDKETRKALNQLSGGSRAATRSVELDVGLRAAGAPKGAVPRTKAARSQLIRLGREVTRQTSTKQRRVDVKKTEVAGLPVGQLVSDAAGSVGKGHGAAAVRFAGKDVPRFAGRAAKDVVLLPVNAVKGGYEVVAAANESAQALAKPLDVVLPGKGSHKRSKALAKGLTEGALGHSVRAAANAVEGDSKAAKKHAGLAAKAFGEHPVYSTLEFTGAYAAVGRGGGALARRAPKGSRLRRAGQTKRAPLKVRGTNIALERSYSKNLFTAAGQRKLEQRKRSRGGDPNEAAPSKVRDAAATVTGNAVRPGEKGMIHMLEDERVAQQEIRGRVGRDESRADVQKAAKHVRGQGKGRRKRTTSAVRRGAGSLRPGGKVRSAVRAAAIDADQHLVKLANEHRIAPATLRADLEREKERLDRAYEDEHGTLHLMDAKNQAAANNRATATAIDSMLERLHRDPEAADAAAGRVFEAAQLVRGRAHETTAGAVAAQAVEPEQAVAASIRPTAIGRYGARHDEAIVDAPDQAKAYAAAKDAERAARAETKTAGKDRRKADRSLLSSTRKAAREEGRTKILDTQGRAKQAVRSEEARAEAAALTERAAKMKAAANRTIKGPELAAPEGPRSMSQRRYRNKRDRLGLVGGRPRGAQIGSQSYRRAQRQFARAKAMEARAAELTREADSLPGKKTAAFAQRIETERVTVANRITELEQRIEKTTDPEEGAALFEAHAAARARLKDVERIQGVTKRRLQRSDGETAPAALARLEKSRAALQVAERRVAETGARAKAAAKAEKAAAAARREAKPSKVEVGLTVPGHVDVDSAPAVVAIDRQIAATEAKLQRIVQGDHPKREEWIASNEARLGDLAARREAEAARLQDRGVKLTTGDILERMTGEGLLSERTGDAVAAWRAAGGDRDSPEYVGLIQAALEDPKMPGFISNKGQAANPSSAYRVTHAGANRPTMDAQRRTGDTTRLGADDTDLAAVEAAIARSRGEVDAIQGFDDFAGQWGQKKPDGTMYTPAEARKQIAAMHQAGEPDVVAISTAPQRYGPQRIEQIGDMQRTQPESLAAFRARESLLDDRINEALRVAAQEEGPRNVVLVRREALQRYTDHQSKVTSPLAQTGQKLTSVFRGTVLPFSPKWLTGNVVEALLRSTLNGVTPIDVVRGARVIRDLEKLDANAAREFEMRATGGLLFGTSERLNVYRDRTALDDTGLQPLAEGAGAVARTPIVKMTLDGLDEYQRAVFGVNKWIEKQYQRGVVGKETRREIRELADSWEGSIRMHKDAYEDVLKGLTGTDKQVRFAMKVDEVLGKYTRFSPTTRRVTQIAMPFLPWYLNAYRFVLHTLPVQHPIKTGLMANVENTYDQMFEEQRAAVPPGALQAAVPTKDGGLRDLARYTPFGAFSELPSGALDAVFPQLSSSFNLIASGRSYTGRPAELSDGTKLGTSDWRSIPLAMYSMFESVMPGVSIARRLREGGETAYADSTFWDPKTKPGTAQGPPSTGAAVKRIVDPFRPIYLGGGSGGELSPADKKALEEVAPTSTIEESGDPVQDELDRYYEEQGAAVDDEVESALDDYFESGGR